MAKWNFLAAALLFSSGTVMADINTQVYGYIEGYVEKVEKSPSRSGGTSTTAGASERSNNPYEFDTPHIHVMAKSTSSKGYSAFLNLNASDGTTRVANAWFEGQIKGELLKFRIGKLYRPFGLYNERLDAAPTYIGIEAPELFDGDHLLLTRTTNFMIHGETYLGSGLFRYSLTTGNDEKMDNDVPVGGDVRYTSYGDTGEWTYGTSFYFSGKSGPTSGVGEGSPDGGVINWMDSDRFKVFGLYTEYRTDKWTLQTAFYQADHKGKRNGSKLQQIGTDSLNQRQINMLCNGDMSTCADSIADYSVKTWYVRIGRAFATGLGEFTPYVQWDFYENPETIASKSDGGDNEAGLADDGKFNKQTLGVVYRPDPSIAIKLDASNHSQKVDGENLNYAEIRASFSYIWSL